MNALLKLHTKQSDFERMRGSMQEEGRKRRQDVWEWASSVRHHLLVLKKSRVALSVIYDILGSLSSTHHST